MSPRLTLMLWSLASVLAIAIGARVLFVAVR
jgi:hypothetical protein